MSPRSSFILQYKKGGFAGWLVPNFKRGYRHWAEVDWNLITYNRCSVRRNLGSMRKIICWCSTLKDFVFFCGELCRIIHSWITWKAYEQLENLASVQVQNKNVILVKENQLRIESVDKRSGDVPFLLSAWLEGFRKFNQISPKCKDKKI